MSFLALAFSSSIAFTFYCSMVDTTVHDPATPVAPSVNDEDGGHDSEAERTAMAALSSPTCGATKMTDEEILELTDFFKKTTVTEDDRRAYHDRGWLADNLVSFIPEVDVPTVEGSTILCFKSQLVVGLGLPPSKFLSSIMNYLGCSLVHLNAKVVSALSGFIMLCECWLGIPLDTSLFWYYYSPAWYIKTIFGRIGIFLRRKRRDEYIQATFKGCWKGAQQKWILVDMHVQPPWVNKLSFPLAVKNKQMEPPMTDRLAALIKRVAELWQAGLEVCH
jgi:TM2 domain-containing membrane protein YozV